MFSWSSVFQVVFSFCLWKLQFSKLFAVLFIYSQALNTTDVKENKGKFCSKYIEVYVLIFGITILDSWVAEEDKIHNISNCQDEGETPCHTIIRPDIIDRSFDPESVLLVFFDISLLFMTNQSLWCWLLILVEILKCSIKINKIERVTIKRHWDTNITSNSFIEGTKDTNIIVWRCEAPAS